jgi:hypothetical protein
MFFQFETSHILRFISICDILTDSSSHIGKRSASSTGRFTLEETVPGTHFIGGWVGSRLDLDAE